MRSWTAASPKESRSSRRVTRASSVALLAGGGAVVVVAVCAAPRTTMTRRTAMATLRAARYIWTPLWADFISAWGSAGPEALRHLHVHAEVRLVHQLRDHDVPGDTDQLIGLVLGQSLRGGEEVDHLLGGRLRGHHQIGIGGHADVVGRGVRGRARQRH